jgi:hypothetical protein
MNNGHVAKTAAKSVQIVKLATGNNQETQTSNFDLSLSLLRDSVKQELEHIKSEIYLLQKKKIGKTYLLTYLRLIY